MGLAARVAHGLQLHREEAYRPLTFFQVQLHRRAWYQLLTLDFQFSIDRGTDAAVPTNGYNTRLPLNLNDTDFDCDSPMTQVESTEPTEMTLMMIATEIQVMIRRLSLVPVCQTTSFT